MNRNKKRLVLVLALSAMPFAAIGMYWTERDLPIKTSDEHAITNLSLENPGCSITGPNGEVIDPAKSTVIPKGSVVTGQCFSNK